MTHFCTCKSGSLIPGGEKMAVSKKNRRRNITLSNASWLYLEGLVEEKKGTFYCGKNSVSSYIEKLVRADIELKKAGFK